MATYEVGTERLKRVEPISFGAVDVFRPNRSFWGNRQGRTYAVHRTWRALSPSGRFLTRMCALIRQERARNGWTRVGSEAALSGCEADGARRQCTWSPPPWC